MNRAIESYKRDELIKKEGLKERQRLYKDEIERQIAKKKENDFVANFKLSKKEKMTNKIILDLSQS